MLFSTFSSQYLGLKNNKIKTILTIFSVYYNRSFPQNLSHWLLEKSEMIEKTDSTEREKTCSAMSASVSLARILAHVKAWDLVL